MGLTLLFVAAGGAAAAEGPEAAAARRAEARNRVVEILKERSVRPVEDRVVAADAKALVSRMSDAQVESLLSGEALETALAVQAPAAAATDGGPAVRAVVEKAVGDATSDLLFVPISPCRIIDTRLGGGKMAVNETRAFEVAGTANFAAQGGNNGGCGIPQGASTPQAAAVMVNLVAIDAEGRGNLAAWQFGQPAPLASSINYANINMNIANGLIVPIAGVSTAASDINIKASFAAVHIVADVTGYFTRFPVENFQGGLKSTVQTVDFTTLTSLSDGGCKELNSCTVTADVDGTVIVEAWGQFVANHTGGSLDRVAIGVETVSPVVCNDSDSVNASDFEVSAALGSNPDVDFTISHGRAFTQGAGTTRTYRLSGEMLNGASAGDAIENSRVICTFIPD
jgi:hypothetical protein